MFRYHAQSKDSLSACSKPLYACLCYFAWHTSLPSNKHIWTLNHAIVRSVTFSKHLAWNNFTEYPQRWSRFNNINTSIFKSLGAPTKSSRNVDDCVRDVDVLDIFLQIQPTLNLRSSILTPFLESPARNRSSRKVTSEATCVVKRDLVSLLILFNEILGGVAVRYSRPSPGAQKPSSLNLAISRVKIPTVSYHMAEWVTTDAFVS